MPRAGRGAHVAQQHGNAYNKPADGGDGEEDGVFEGEWGGEDGYAGEYGDEDDYGEGVTVYQHATDEPVAPLEADVAVDAFLDPLALVHAWEGALSDLKDAHPERFLPPTEAPLTLAQKQVKAPFWYGPPPHEASTSKLPPAPVAGHALPTTFAAASLREPSPTISEHQQPQMKKRKRLTGSQKKARKAAKLAAGTAPESTASFAGDEDEDAHAFALDVPPHQGHGASPPKPSIAAAAPPAPAVATGGPSQPAAPPPACMPGPPSLSRRALSPSAFLSLVPPTTSLPRTYPAPPPIVPLTGAEPPLEPETPEALLEAALWSWYTAGYQTALYHAASGVAKFRRSEGDEEGRDGQGS
ncbi:uncharacterized protein JCM10292_005586 [Rhodotorula paludigena]|uniref:uncharacterized protein n=1 Tax=Rhodotorula paludigena TaxID=86838 RepID=UPI00317043C8